MRTFLILVCCGFRLSSTFAQQIDYKGFPEWSWNKKDSTEYFLYTPGGIERGKRYPIALVLHGCCGQDYHATLRNTVDPLVRMWHSFGENTQRIPTYIIAPKTSKGWAQHAENLKAVIDNLVAEHQGDPKRIYITGFSMGAEGTWHLLEKYPDYFAAAIPVGMKYTGKDPEKIKHIPIWTLRGQNDWWAKTLGSQIANIRQRNGWMADSSEHVVGVNPRLTTFLGMGHGVMWPSASQYDLPGWAYTKVNDGNKYPIVFFNTPVYKQIFGEGEMVRVSVNVYDPDGKIKNVDFFVNGNPVRSSKKFSFQFKAPAGDAHIEAIAYDNKGKTATASTRIKVNIPALLTTSNFIDATQGEWYEQKITGHGNGRITFFPKNSSAFPDGLHLTEDGILKGIPVKDGQFTFTISAKDEDGDLDEKEFRFVVKKKNPNQVLVTEAKDYTGKSLPVIKATKGSQPFFDRYDGEVSLSYIPSEFYGLTLIQTSFHDTVTARPHYARILIDEPSTVYVAYEKLDRLHRSSVPDWLKTYRRVGNEQIVAQYFYYDVYAKDFPKGTITFPDAEEKKNGVNTNYFILIKKSDRHD
jgi:dienelactone hydrolase